MARSLLAGSIGGRKKEEEPRRGKGEVSFIFVGRRERDGEESQRGGGSCWEIGVGFD